MVPKGEDFQPLAEVTTLYDSFLRSSKLYADRPALGFRSTTNGTASAYQWLSYAQTAQQAADLGASLMSAGLKPKGRCGIYGVNSPQWMLAMQVGAQLHGIHARFAGITASGYCKASCMGISAQWVLG